MDLVADTHHHLYVVLDQHDAHAPVLDQPADQAPQLGRLLVVQAGGRLVQAEDARLGGDGPGDADQAPLAIQRSEGIRSSRESSWKSLMAARAARVSGGVDGWTRSVT